jgi:hypothetical protein
VGHDARRLWILVCLVVPSPAGGQLPPVGVPGGVVRLDLDGSIESFDRRFFDGHREGYGADLASSALGSDRMPLLAEADARVGRIIGNTSYRLNLGGLVTDAMADIGRGSLGLSLGITDAITIFGRMPLVHTRVQNSMRLDPANADAGLNPGAAPQAGFFGEFDAALAALSAKIAGGDYDSNPTQLALAQATLADAAAVRADLFGLLVDPLSAAPAVPTAGSSSGSSILGRVAGIQNVLTSSLDVPGFTLAPTLPSSPLNDEELDQILATRLALRTGELITTFRGDAEVGLSVTLVDNWDRQSRRGGFRAAISALARLPTGSVARTDHPLAIGTGDGQTDLQADVVTDLGSGNLGLRLAGTYVRQLEADYVLRVTAPRQPFVGPERLARVSRDLGDILALDVRPFYRIARTLALQVGVQHWSREADEASYVSAADSLPNISAGVLAEESSSNATILSAGLTYANPGGLRRGGTGWPVDAGWTYQRVLRSGGGRVPDSHVVRGWLRLYFGLW